jgi:hypothetical protein
MLINFYYFIGVFILLSVISQLLKFNKLFSIIEWYDKFEKITGNKAKKGDFRNESEWTIFISRNILLIIEGFWIIFGFITNNWFIFILLVIYGKILSFLFGNIKYTLIGKYVYLKYYILKVFLYGFMIINNFHIGLDLWKIFKDFLLSL